MTKEEVLAGVRDILASPNADEGIGVWADGETVTHIQAGWDSIYNDHYPDYYVHTDPNYYVDYVPGAEYLAERMMEGLYEGG